MEFIETLTTTAEKHREKTGKPFVTLTYAQSLDGCISSRPGEAVALSCQQSLKLTHKLRACHDAILVGIGTVLSDNPRLNVRLVNGDDPQPVVVDSHLRLPLGCKLLNQESLSPWIITLEKPNGKKWRTLESMGAKIHTVSPNEKGKVDLPVMLKMLGDIGINSLMVEGGARIITNFLADRLANYIVLTVAPVLLGGLRAVSNLGITPSGRCLRLENRGHRWLGEDLILWGSLT
jgi:riboflavin-specific deaminase-like protein